MTDAARRVLDAPVLVLDIGGTKLAGGVLVNQQIVCRAETETNAADGVETILDRLVSLAHARLDAFHRDFPQQGQPTQAGVASAGQVEAATGTIAYATHSLPGWIGLPLGARLTAALDMPVSIENDVNCFAVAEAEWGAGRGFANLLMVTVGTGIGGGVIIDGKLYRGRRGGAGEIGQLLVERTGGRPCSERVSGCLEAYAASSVMVARSGYASIQALGVAYRSGHDIPAVDEGATWLGFGLASLAHTLAPDAIIIGGSIGLLGPRYLDAIEVAFRAHTLGSHRSTPLLPAALGPDSGLVGAGLLARQV